MVGRLRDYCLGLLVIGCLLLSACAPPPRVVVVERQTIDARLETEKIGGRHIRIAQTGDTLHGIAFENGINANKLAAWNDLSDTNRLIIGQRIRLTPPINYTGSINTANTNISTHSSVKILPTKKKTTKPKPAITKAPRGLNSESRKLAEQWLRWRWPTNGKVVAHFFLAAGRQGIDISGNYGQAVVAASAGEVVYVGNGLKGYGNLVIIKHNARFLSAYAHNQETFVREGQAVVANYRIASLGRDKSQREALHFQIRKDGQPVNPLNYLPKK